MDFIEILKVIGLVLFGGLSIYFKYNEKLQTKIASITKQAVMLIKKAEDAYKDTTKAGGEKFIYVVDQLYGMIPKPFNLVITKTMVEEIVQSTFEEMEAYAKEQLNNAVNKVEEKKL